MLLANQSIISKEVPVLVYANKMDLDSAMGSEEVCSLLELDSISNRPWSINACNAKEGEGVQEGMEWLSKVIKK